MTTETVKARRSALLKTPNPLSEKKVRELSSALNLILADAFALYLKTKNFHWHVSGPHFRDYHLLLDEQADQIFAITDTIAERVRKIGMLAELRDDNMRIAAAMREVHVYATIDFSGVPKKCQLLRHPGICTAFNST